MSVRLAVFIFFALLPAATSAQSIGGTKTLAPLVGRLYTPAQGQANIGFYTTDLGYTFKHNGALRILFGDTWANNSGTTIGPLFPLSDDSQGTISLANFPSGDAVDAYVAAHPPAAGKLSWQAAAPPVTLRTNLAGQIAWMSVFRDGVQLDMREFRAPTAGFSNGTDGAFAIFDRSVATECSGGFNPSCAGGLTCDRGIGSCLPFSGEDDLPCVIGTTRCLCLPVAGGGMCQDRTSSLYNTSEDGRILSIALRTEVANADPNIHEIYYSQSWQTNKFINPTVRTVNDFSPSRANGTGNDYGPADGVAPTANEKVFVWGRPDFVGINATGLNVKMYFAYVDMPRFSASGRFAWSPKYFAGFNADQTPKFSALQRDAIALDLSGGADSTRERYDVVDQVSISWVAPLQKWVMLYGGDMAPDVLSFFVGPNSTLVVRDPEGAIHARFASQPWGPWSAPVQVLKAGDPSVSPPVAGTQYASGGILYHPGCSSDCAPAEAAASVTTPGVLYAPNIIDAWTTAREYGAADIYWNVSTSNPYEVVLMKTRINP